MSPKIITVDHNGAIVLDDSSFVLRNKFPRADGLPTGGWSDTNRNHPGANTFFAIGNSGNKYNIIRGKTYLDGNS